MQKKILLGVLAVCIAFSTAAYAKPGGLDSSFGSDGKVTTDIGGDGDVARSVAIQNDGKIVAAGFSRNGSGNYDFAIIRYDSNGSLDSSFNDDGKVTTAIGGSDESDYAESVAIQKDGKIVVAGGSYINSFRMDFAIVRYDSDGSLDSSFDNDGIVTTAIGSSYDGAAGMAIQNNGKIVAAGLTRNSSGHYDFAIVRYDSNGSLDSSFNFDGIATIDLRNGDDMALSVAIQNDGKIVVAGKSDDGSGNYDFAIVRYNSDGSLDSSFDGDGKVTTAVGSDRDYATSVTIQKDGKLVVVGYSQNSSGNYDFAIVRYNSDGSLDSSFSDDGKVTTDIGGGWDEARSVAIQNDGKIVTAGFSWNSSSNKYNFAIVRYNSDGSLDSSFDGDGIVTTSIGSSYDQARSVTIQNDGKIVVAGLSEDDSHMNDFAIVRYLGDPVPLAPIYYLLQ